MASKLNLLVLFIILGVNSYGQVGSIKFDQGKEEGISSIIQLDINNTYIAYNKGDSIDEFFPFYDETFIAVLDSNLQLKKQIKLNSSFVFHMDTINQKLYSYGHHIDYINFTFNLVIHKIDFQLNLLDSFKVEIVGNSAWCQNFSIHPISQNIFLPYNFIDSLKGKRVSKVLELDTNFNIIRNVEYDTLYFGPNSCNFDPDGNLLVLNVNNQQSSVERHIVFKLDSSLKPINSFSPLSNQYNDLMGDTIGIGDYTSVHTLKNGNILVSGEIINDVNYQPNIDFSYLDYGFALFDSTNSLLKFELVGEIDHPDFVAFGNNAVSDKSFYMVGSNRWLNIDYYKTYQNYIQVNKYDLQGNLIFQNTYSFDGYSRINSVSITEDEGLLMAGSDYKASKPAGSGLDGLIVRLDSLGNIVSINYRGLISDKKELIVYPNPASDFITFEKLNFFAPSELKIYDTRGQLIKILSFKSNSLTMPTSELRSGIYFYESLNEKGERFKGKFIVE